MTCDFKWPITPPAVLLPLLSQVFYSVSLTYWRHTNYTGNRTLVAIVLGLVIGSLFFQLPLTSVLTSLTCSAFVFTLLIFGPTSNGGPVVGFNAMLQRAFARERRARNYYASAYAITFTFAPVRTVCVCACVCVCLLCVVLWGPSFRVFLVVHICTQSFKAHYIAPSANHLLLVCSDIQVSIPAHSPLPPSLPPSHPYPAALPLLPHPPLRQHRLPHGRSGSVLCLAVLCVLVLPPPLLPRCRLPGALHLHCCAQPQGEGALGG